MLCCGKVSQNFRLNTKPQRYKLTFKLSLNPAFSIHVVSSCLFICKYFKNNCTFILLYKNKLYICKRNNN